MTVKFDFDKGIYSGVGLGQSFSHKLSIVNEEANIVIFKSDDAKIVCQIQDNGSIILTKEGGIPLLFEKIN
ncbi:hypothetical protein [Desulfoluna butyratoxydans]|uniref:hypothetical protein n=1 Tax=Desulfoluna butyratoxydans TaxID=231438 RepID=UPI0015D2E81B|nr:hypothetical protein [Desulfoluna butyratoxydans]